MMRAGPTTGGQIGGNVSTDLPGVQKSTGTPQTSVYPARPVENVPTDV